MEKQKSIKLNMIMNFLLTISNTLFPLITYSYVARVLSPTGTGKVAFVESILSYFIFIASLGIPAYGRREVAKVRDSKEKLSHLVEELFIFNLGSTVISYISLWIIVLFVPRFRGYELLFLIMGGQIPLKLIGMEWLYEGLEEYTYITIRSLIFKTVSVVLTFALVQNSDDVVWYGFVHVFTVSASYMCNFINVRKYISIRKITFNMKKHLKSVLMLFSASVAITIYANFDVSMIGFINTEYEVGLYNVALKIKMLVLAVSTAVTAVLVPRVSYYFHNGEKDKSISLLSKSIRFSMLTAMPVAMYVFIFSENVLYFIGGPEYGFAASTLKILMLCIVALIITNLCGAQILIPVDKEKRYTQSVFVGLLINLALNMLLIPKMGAFGAAIGTLVTEIWNVIWMGLGCLDYIKLLIKRVALREYIGPLIISMLCSYIVSFKLTGFTVFWQLAITAVLYFGCYYIILMWRNELLIKEITEKIIKKFRSMRV